MSPTLAAVVASLLGLGAAAAPAPEAVSPLDRLEAAVAAHPDDADLAAALARELERAGRPADAAARLAGVARRSPARAPELWLEVGRLRYAAGDHAGALEALSRAEPPGTMHFYRGLALRRLGRAEEADRAFAVAARLEPELRAEAALLRGLDRLARGDRAGGRALLEEAVDHDRSGAIARSARAALGGDAAPSRERPLTLFASAGYAYDSNVTLDSGTLPGSSDEADRVATWGAGILLRPLRGETSTATLGYRFQSSLHEDLEDYDLDTHALSAGAAWRPSERLALRLDGVVASTLRDDSRYAHVLTGQPNALVALGPRAGVLRVFGEVTHRDYAEAPLVDSLSRDGRTYGAGLSHLWAPLDREGAWSVLTARFARTNTEADDDPFGFEGDYDGVRWEASSTLRWPLVHGFAANATFVVARERYFERNLIDALTGHEGAGSADPVRRRDTLLESRLGLERPLSPYVMLELAWRYTRAISNVDVYDYDRHVVGTYLRVQY